MTTDNKPAAMQTLLDRQVAALDQVLDSLTEERNALLRRDAAALELAAREKQLRLAAVDALEKERMVLAPDLSSMEALAAAPEVARRWEKLLDLTRRCRENNDANGRMIRRQQRRVASTLQLIQGRPAEIASVYGPDGESRSASKARPPIASV